MCTLLSFLSGDKELGAATTYRTGCCHPLNVSPSSRAKDIQLTAQIRAYKNFQTISCQVVCYSRPVYVQWDCYTLLSQTRFPKQYVFRQYPTKGMHDCMALRVFKAYDNPYAGHGCRVSHRAVRR